MSKLLELKNIIKKYPGVTALDNVSMSFKSGEVHAIMGENGAGKSTLIKIISGAIEPTDGIIVTADRKEYDCMTPARSKDNGIGVVYQEFTLIPSLSVADNIFLGNKVGGRILVDFAEMNRRAESLFEELKVNIDPQEMVSQLSTAQQQVVEIAKAVSRDARLIIMDEPSSALAASEVEGLFSIIRRLRSKGIAIIYISHRIDEIFEISDTISILRDGRYITTKVIGEITRSELITYMVGRELSEKFPERKVKLGEIVLQIENLTGKDNFDINLSLRKGEILGLAGLVGSGRTELAKMIYGAAKIESGDIIIKGKKIHITSPDIAISQGIGLIPEDRKTEGVQLEMPIDWNITIMILKEISHYTVVSLKKINEISKKYADRFAIKTPDLQQLVKNLSGGNQQKVVLAKILAAKTDIILFDEPTRGIDIGAKHEIYKLMNELVEEGISIIVISSEMEELMGMSDRILVLHEGRITGEVMKKEFSQDKIMALASGM